MSEVIKSFTVRSDQSHGMLVLSKDSLNCLVWIPGVDKPVYADQITIVGNPIQLIYPSRPMRDNDPKYQRQSFLGRHSDFFLQNVRVGIIGLGGGGSHIAQQLAHLGVTSYTIFDEDKVEDTNLNRLVGGHFADIKNATQKTVVAERVIKGIIPEANVCCVHNKWETSPHYLQACDIVFGCIDSVSGRRDLEAECRRNLIPLIDIGMDVHKSRNNSFEMRGQIILSMPEAACMHCFGFITEDSLRKEAEKYGHAGSKPQVVWSNGILASAAVGMFVQLITNWAPGSLKDSYLAYDGNACSLDPHVRSQNPLFDTCTHYPISEAGPPKWKTIK
jgi:hypothetical protein